MDIDGPLSYNSTNEQIKINDSLSIPYAWDPDQCSALASIISSTGASVVISSDWRSKYSVDELNSIFEYYGIPGTVIDTTGFDRAKFTSWLDHDRAYQIAKWIKEHQEEVEEWVSIDDLNVGKWFERMSNDYPFLSKSRHIRVHGDWSEECLAKLTDCKDKIIEALNGRIKHRSA